MGLIHQQVFVCIALAFILISIIAYIIHDKGESIMKTYGYALAFVILIGVIAYSIEFTFGLFWDWLGAW